jgi:hypothetical protein
MPLDGGMFGVEVVIPDTNPTMVSGFATEASAQAWVVAHKKQAIDNPSLSRPRHWRRSRRPSGQL